MVEEEALALADQHRPRTPRAVVDFARHLRALGHDVRIKPLRAAEGGLEAVTARKPDGTFRFVCDPAGEWPSPGDVPYPEAHRISFRLAHEYAHVLLDEGFAPMRRFHRHELTEEACDRLATLLLCDPKEAARAMSSGPEATREYCRKRNVPTTLAVAAAGLVPPKNR